METEAPAAVLIRKLTQLEPHPERQQGVADQRRQLFEARFDPAIQPVLRSYQLDHDGLMIVGHRVAPGVTNDRSEPMPQRELPCVLKTIAKCVQTAECDRGSGPVDAQGWWQTAARHGVQQLRGQRHVALRIPRIAVAAKLHGSDVSAERQHAADAVLGLHQLKRGIDLGQRHPM